MSRPTQVTVSPTALLHNLRTIQTQAPKAKIIAMVKANAYGCGIENIAPFLEDKVAYFGVISAEEALAIRSLGLRTPCLIIQGVFEPHEWLLAAEHDFEYVISREQQLQWLVNTPLKQPISVWLKINTGMNRLGISPKALPSMMTALQACKWVKQPISLMTHFANADAVTHPFNAFQCEQFKKITDAYPESPKSLANSAAIFQYPEAHADFIRPGISLYGISPCLSTTGQELGLKPVVTFTSKIIDLYPIQPHDTVGYGSTWIAKRPSRIGIVPVGYGDGYPRHVQGASVWIQGKLVPIVGIISMDTMTLDVTDFPEIKMHDTVELWGTHLPIEKIAAAAGTIPYELLCQITGRPRG